MKFSENWLRTFVDPRLSTRELADLLTFGGIEVEGTQPAAPAFDRVVVGEVLSVEKHPNADRLNVCQVNIADNSTAAPLTIVCGAPNVRAGMRVPAALVGAKLPGMEIKAAKVRGVESSGMLCSAKELGISDAADGLLALAADATIGVDVRQVLDLNDIIFDSKPTPNRGDCLSLRGLAREVAALSGTALQAVDVPVVSAGHDHSVAISLNAPKACPLYCGRLVRGVNVQAPTPDWMVRRLARSGVRSISAVVDVTNYVMLELGQPMHAFDAGKIDGGIRVRFAAPGEKLELLNGETRALDAEFLLIADDKKALALAGIMGGAQSAVGDATRDILLEAAYFDPDVIAGKSRVLGFGSDSSFRFERGVDFAATREAMERATQLVLDICGGSAGPVAVAESAAHLPARKSINLRLSRVARVLGMAFTAVEVASIFQRLGFVHALTADGLSVTPPAYRFDVSMEEDLIEEVARVHGYNRIPAAAPVVASVALPQAERNRPAAGLRRALAARDYQEVVTYSFVDRAWEADFCANTAPIALANPIASQMSVMRSSLIGGLVSTVAYNLHHKQARVRVFEAGRCFVRGGADYQQPWRIAAAVCGDAAPDQWGVRPPRRVDFYDVKADLEALLQTSELTFAAASHPALHPGKSARVLRSGNTIGWIGELHPRWQQKYDLPAAPVLFEIELSVAALQALPVYHGISKFPPVLRDLAVLLDEKTPYQAILDAVNAQKPAAITEFSVFDIYRGAGIESGKKSLAFRMLVQDTHKTLTDAEVDSAVSEIIKILHNQFNAKLR
jgi:phenylalanyl-tRNA synthetase beta chain